MISYMKISATSGEQICVGFEKSNPTCPTWWTDYLSIIKSKSPRAKTRIELQILFWL